LARHQPCGDRGIDTSGHRDQDARPP
jgi:hypothetical protein